MKAPLHSRRKFLFIASCALFLSACGSKYKDEIKPIYQAENLQIQDEHVQYWSDIKPTTVEPIAIRTITQAIFGWIPVLGGIVTGVIELPIDLTEVLLPAIPSTSYPALPANGAWNDPAILKVVSGLRLGAGYIRITPRELRPAGWKPDKCWVFWDCPDVGIDEFLKEVRVYLEFKDLKADVVSGKLARIDQSDAPQILLASADTNTAYNKETQTLYFNVSQENIRPYLDQYERFQIKLVASGGLPAHTVFLDGRLRLDLDLKLSNP